MKKFLPLLIILLISRLGYSQFYLGLSYNEALKQISKNKYTSNIERDKTSTDGQIIIDWKISEPWSAYTVLFFQNNISTHSFVVPDNTTILSKMIETFNKDLVIISTEEWHAYSNGKIVDIKVIYSEELKKYMFWFKFIQ